MRLVFAGTPEFAVPSLDALVEAGHEIPAVITQPDRPRGRKLVLRPLPVKERALALGLEVRQPEDVNSPEFLDNVPEPAPDAVVVVAFGQIFRARVLEWPRLGCINVHASLLPRYRGAAPVHHAILNGDPVTGVSLMKLDHGVDSGPVYSRREVGIGPDETAGKLEARLAELGARLLVETLDQIRSAALAPQPQNHSAATYAPMIMKQEARIHWSRAADDLHNIIRAMNPRPMAFAFLGENRVRVLESRLDPDQAETGGQPGLIRAVDRDRGLLVDCGRGRLWLGSVQPGGKKPMSGHAFSLGYGPLEGQFLS